MIKKGYIKSALIGVILLAYILMLSQIVIAGLSNKEGKKYLSINEVTVDFTSSLIQITGEHFAGGIEPIVTLGDDTTPLMITNYSAKEIIAELPAIPDGDYSVKV